ncbi:MAG: sulfurtransferase [Gammaproteobacteria bacterium]|jgi:UPF0176 protein|nr:sulfurtransferase [Gammaproteobacteria bacterium]
MSYTNISGYKFTKLTNLESLQQNLKQNCVALDLKGTILLGSEGINVFLCGKIDAIESFYQFIPTTGLPEIEFKESSSQVIPFKHMHVKIKSEIVTMGVPQINVVEQTAPYLEPALLKQWLDENKDIILLDTRNEYEVGLGTFKNAIELHIQNFRSFPKAVQTLPEEFKDKTIVTFCTGGIRCEKAAPYLITQGFKDVYQLQGGILKYIEKFQNTHFQGECFVFDKRIAVDTELKETHTVQCHGCRHPVSEHDQQSEYYIEGQSCPKCFEGI